MLTADHFEIISTALKFKVLANSFSDSALSTFVYAAQLIIKLGEIFEILFSKLFKSDKSKSLTSVKTQSK